MFSVAVFDGKRALMTGDLDRSGAGGFGDEARGGEGSLGAAGSAKEMGAWQGWESAGGLCSAGLELASFLEDASSTSAISWFSNSVSLMGSSTSTLLALEHDSVPRSCAILATAPAGCGRGTEFNLSGILSSDWPSRGLFASLSSPDSPAGSWFSLSEASSSSSPTSSPASAPDSASVAVSVSSSRRASRRVAARIESFFLPPSRVINLEMTSWLGWTSIMGRPFLLRSPLSCSSFAFFRSLAVLARACCLSFSNSFRMRSCSISSMRRCSAFESLGPLFACLWSFLACLVVMGGLL